MTATSIQVEELLEYMGQHKDLARGLIHNVEGRARAKRLWEDLAARLNSLGGGVKSVKQWKKPLEQPTPTEDSEQEGQEEQHAWPGTAPAVPVQADTSNDLSALRLSGRRLPGRTLRAAPVPDIRTQILEIEEEKRDVLVGILKEVKELNESIKKIIEKF